MSLDAIRRLRRAGHKPAVVWVVIGDRPQWLDDDAGVVHISAEDNPALMDWMPMVGVLTVIVQQQILPRQMLAVLDALTAIGAKLYGAVDRTGVHPLLEGADEAHEKPLRRAMELLCQ